jgi:serine/threonine protein kinase
MAMTLGQVLHRSFNAFVASPDHWARYQALAAAAAAPEAGPSVNHRSFEVKGRLGTGGYSTVYAAVKRDTGALYAMKCIDKRLIHSKGVSRLLLGERDILGIVDSPFVASLRYAFHSITEVCLISGEAKDASWRG